MAGVQHDRGCDVSMTPEQRKAEYKRFLEAYPDRVAIPRVCGFAYPQCDGWMRRAEIAIAERAELQAENERLRERVSELESSPTIDELESYRSPMDEAQARPLRDLVAEWQARVQRSEDREQEIRDRSGDWPLGRRVESDVDE